MGVGKHHEKGSTKALKAGLGNGRRSVSCSFNAEIALLNTRGAQAGLGPETGQGERGEKLCVLKECHRLEIAFLLMNESPNYPSLST